jgi:chaperonin cofactor prefoldin
VKNDLDGVEISALQSVDAEEMRSGVTITDVVEPAVQTTLMQESYDDVYQGAKLLERKIMSFTLYPQLSPMQLSQSNFTTNVINQQGTMTVLETKHISDMFRRAKPSDDMSTEIRVDRLEREFKRFEKEMKEYIDLKFNTLDTKVDTVDTKVDTLDTKVDTVDTKIDKLQDLIKQLIDKKDPPATTGEIPDTQSRDLLVDPTTTIAPIVRRKKKSKRAVLLNIVKMKSV